MPAAIDGSNTPTTVGEMDTLLRICGITDASQQKYLRNDQKLRYYNDWLDMDEKDLKSIADTTRKLPSGPFVIPVIIVKRLVALRTWINDQILLGGTLDGINVGDFTASAVREYVQIAFRTDQTPVDPPDTLIDTDHWVTWRKHLLTYLQTITGEMGCPLSYILRLDVDRPSTTDDLTRGERIFWNAPHGGYAFEEDNKSVYQVLQTLLEKSSCAHVITSFEKSQDAVNAYKELSGLYDGEGEVTKRSIAARANLKNLRYQDERTKKFTTIVAEMKGHFTTQRRARCPIAPKEQVNKLCDDVLAGITNIDIRTAINSARNQFPEDFARAANMISTAICRVSPTDGGKRGVSETTSTAGSSNDWNSYDAKYFCNGVDLRNVLNPTTPNMPSDQWNRLPDSAKIAIAKERAARRRQQDGDRKQYRKASKIRSKNKRRKIAHDSSDSSDTDTSATGATEQRSASAVFGKKRAPRKAKQTEFDPSTGRCISRVVSSTRKTELPPINLSIADVIASATGTKGKASTIESDNHADTWCCGKNFIFNSYTGETCDVSGFNNELASPSIRVGTGYTVRDDPLSGRSYLLEVNQGLDMREHIDHTLMNPNQSRAYGIDICDDPYDPYRDFGISIPEQNVFIPFTLDGSSAVFTTRPPTREEMETLYDSRIIFTSHQTWNPRHLPNRKRHSSQIQISDRKTKRTISDVISTDVQALRCNVNLSALKVCDECEIDAGLVNSTGDDRLLADVSTGLTDETLLPRLVSNVNVSEDMITSSSNTAGRHSDISAESLASKFRIGVPQAALTLRRTTQQGIRQAMHPITRRYRTDVLSMKYKRLRAIFYTDTVPVNVKSLRQNTCFQLYTCQNFVHVHPMQNDKQCPQSLLHLAQDVGIPAEIFSDNANLLTGHDSDFVKQAEFLRTKLSSAEPYTQKHNLCEGENRVLKRRWKNRMVLDNIPKRLWCFALIYDARILSMVARGRDGIPGLERITGESCDITEWLDFGFYDRVWFEENAGNGFKPGRWLGVSHRVGSALCYFVLGESGHVFSRTTVQHIPEEDLMREGVQQTLKEFDKAIRKRLDDTNFVLPNGEDLFQWDVDDSEDELSSDNRLGTTSHKTDDGIKPAVDRDHYTDEEYDHLLDAEVVVPDEFNPEGTVRGIVTKRARYDHGQPKGKRHKHSVLDTRRYVVRFQNGIERELQHNEIAENLWAGADSEGRQFLHLDQIVDHRSNDTALKKSDGWIRRGSNLHRKKTTKGWEFLCLWKDKSQDWVPLKDIKECNPVDVSEYVKAHSLIDEPAFAWWCQHVLKVRNVIIQKVKSRYWKTTHKYGFELPKSLEEARAIDIKNGDWKWSDAVKKEMKTAKVAYKPYFHSKDGAVSPKQIRGNRQRYLVGYTEITCHLVFDIKLDGEFTRKARYVANGSKVELPKSMTYSSVVSRESVRIAFLIAGLNDLEVSACDISGAYLNAPVGEKVWFQAGKECGDDEGTAMIIVRALYGTKSAAKAWKDFFQKSLEGFGYTPCKADENVYMKPRKKEDGTKYWSYLLVYVDDCLLVDHEPDIIMKRLMETYKLKNDKYGEPEQYLGANVGRYALKDGEHWSMSSRDYLTEACKLVKKMSLDDDRRWNPKRLSARK